MISDTNLKHLKRYIQLAEIASEKVISLADLFWS